MRKALTPHTTTELAVRDKATQRCTAQTSEGQVKQEVSGTTNRPGRGKCYPDKAIPTHIITKAIMTGLVAKLSG